MKNQYNCGDINDYCKYGLLRTLHIGSQVGIGGRVMANLGKLWCRSISRQLSP